jgi:hypothetical protein
MKRHKDVFGGRGEGKMKATLLLAGVLAVSLVFAGCVPERYASKANGTGSVKPMTTHDVIAMSKAGVSDSVIVSMMDVTGSHFNLKAGDVVALADSGVSQNVIHAMVSTASQAENIERAPDYFYYPPVYWYDGYSPFWDPWFYSYYPLGFRNRYYAFHGPRFGRFHR